MDFPKTFNFHLGLQLEGQLTWKAFDELVTHIKKADCIFNWLEQHPSSQYQNNDPESWKTLCRKPLTPLLPPYCHLFWIRQTTLTKMSQGKWNTKITLIFQENRWLLYYVPVQQSNGKTLWKKFWSIIEAFQDIWVFKNTKASVWDVEYGLPFIALINAVSFPESQLKL